MNVQHDRPIALPDLIRCAGERPDIVDAHRLAVDRNRRLRVEAIAAVEAEPARARAGRLSVAMTLSGLFARACKLFRGIDLLATHGLGEEAQSLVRNAFELAVNVSYLLKEEAEAEDRAVQYRAWLEVQRARRVREWPLSELTRGATPDELEKAVRADIGDAMYEKLAARPFRSHWTGRSIRDLCKELNADGAYVTLYRYTSQFVHGGVYMTDTDVTVEPLEVSLRLDSDPADFNVAQAFVASNVAFGHVLEALAGECDIDIGACHPFMRIVAGVQQPWEEGA